MTDPILAGGVEGMVEIFDDHIEITNPGEPLVDPSASWTRRRSRVTRHWLR